MVSWALIFCRQKPDQTPGTTNRPFSFELEGWFIHAYRGNRSPPNKRLITGLSPASGIVSSEVTITGRGFGAQQGTSRVVFDQAAEATAAAGFDIRQDLAVSGVAAPVISWSDSEIKIRVPADAPGKSVIKVTVNGVDSNEVPFTVILEATLTFSCDRTDMHLDPRPTQLTTWTATVTSPYKAPLKFKWKRGATEVINDHIYVNQNAVTFDTTSNPRAIDFPPIPPWVFLPWILSVTITDALGRIVTLSDIWGQTF